MPDNFNPALGFFTARDGYRFVYRLWENEHPFARMVCVHGIVSHGGWYLESSNFLARQGFEVHFLERRGSGLNPELRGDVPDHRVWLADLEQYILSLGTDLPVLLTGVSWGGKLAAAFARHRPELISGFGMLCPGLYSRRIPSALSYWGLWLASRFGLDGLSTEIPLQAPDLFTGSPYWQQYIRRDPLTLRRITLRFALADRALTRWVVEAPSEIRRPALLMLAGQDRIVDNDRVRDFAGRLGALDTEVVEFPDGCHTLEFEPDPLPYFQRISLWGKRVVGR